MFYDFRKLDEDEIIQLKFLIEKYKNHDKLDILIEMVAKNPEKIKYNGRNNGKEKKFEETIQVVPQEILYCDGEKCMIMFPEEKN